ncbi:hypothetical protein GX50_02370 [[Emmonsia] crescens]|uniref:Triacylglycerol lipase n=1 Tax=[Emmonsia] crescens TaxID=73230 RepID=A0A2B7ZND3_9EURO|nr:hypothetical protein GX50_02370 [Emmonsia crescens]
MPLFINNAFGDEISPVEDTDKLVQKYCSNGASIEYHRNLIGEHVTEAIIGSVNALEWVSDQLAGRPVQSLGSCMTENIPKPKGGPSAISMLGIELYSLLGSILGDALGPPT